MSEVQSRPSGSRGRGSYRGGRGGHSYRGGRGAAKTTRADEDTVAQESFDDQGEIGELKKKHADKVPMIKEVFPDWTTEDIVFTLEEVNGDEAAAIDRITEGEVKCPSFTGKSLISCEGSASQWGEVKKKHVEKVKSKTKDTTTTSAESNTGSIRGRGRGGIDTRGRGRGDRGRGRGGRVAPQTNGTRAAEKPAKTATNGNWDDTTAATETPADNSWDTTATANGDGATSHDWGSTEAPKKTEETSAPTSTPATSAKPSAWSALFAKPPPVKAAPKPAVPTSTAPPKPAEEKAIDQGAPIAQTQEAPHEAEGQSLTGPPSDPSITLTPSKDELTEINLEQLPDVSHPTESATAASTVASTIDPHSQLNSTNSATRPQLSGFATSAAKATGVGIRSASFNRRVLEQQEAVVMPGDRAVDRAAERSRSIG